VGVKPKSKRYDPIYNIPVITRADMVPKLIIEDIKESLSLLYSTTPFLADSPNERVITTDRTLTQDKYVDVIP
jgi:hypothetical protein